RLATSAATAPCRGRAVTAWHTLRGGGGMGLYVDPAEACQEALEAGLVVHRAHPLNCETSIPALVGGVVMPTARFYVRNHFQIPALDPATFRLSVGGLVE